MTVTDLVLAAAALGAATFGGVLYAFSAFVMHGLDRTPPRSALLAMQRINLSAPRAALVAPMIGTALLAVVAALLDRGPLVVAGALAYLASVAITGGFHVPRNDALAEVDPAGPDAAAAWAAYSGGWLRGNHVRAAAALGGALLLVVALAG